MNAPLAGRTAPHAASSPFSPQEAAEEFLNRLDGPQRLLLAFSGGGDSTGLLLALIKAIANSARPGVTVAAATVDHGLRADSRAEAEQAAALCHRLGIDHAILTWHGDKPKTGIQAAAREARYRLLADHALEQGFDLVLTAHNLDDQIETMAMRQSRNAGSTMGMAESVLVERRVWVHRPFLGVRRSDIRAWLSGEGQGWTEDPSNQNPQFERIRTRRELLTEGTNPPVSLPRNRLARDAAALLQAQCVVHPGLVAELDLEGFSTTDPAHRLALLSLVAVTGGQAHAPGRETAARIFDWLGDPTQTRMTAGRVVLDRRRQWLFLGREGRGLPTVRLRPGGDILWEGRFRIRNAGKSEAVIAPSGMANAGQTLVDMGDVSHLPKSVSRRALSTLPVLIKGDAGGISVEPALAMFEHFLPGDLLELADMLAILAGLDHFPLPVVR